jgi:hypothetical protein
MGELSTQASPLGVSNQGSECSVTVVNEALTPTVSNVTQSLWDADLDFESGIFLYRDSYFHRIANVLGTLIASLIPIGAIVVLYFLSDMSTRLAMVCVFTAIFSVALCLVTSAKRVEVFTATAA